MGAYIESTLLPGERVVFETHYHWIIFFLGPLGFFFIVILVPFTFGLSLLVPLFLFPYFLITRQTSEFAVTDKRVVIKVGWIARRAIELILPQVESVDVRQGIIGRMLDYGAITVVGSGGTHERFRSIARPLNFRRAVQLQQVSPRYQERAIAQS